MMEKIGLEPKRVFTRRDFIKAAGVLAGILGFSSVPTACGPLPTPKEQWQELEGRSLFRFPSLHEVMKYPVQEFLNRIANITTKLTSVPISLLTSLGKEIDSPLPDQPREACFSEPLGSNGVQLQKEVLKNMTYFEQWELKKLMENLFESVLVLGNEGEVGGQKAIPGSPRSLEINHVLEACLQPSLLESEVAAAEEIFFKLIYDHNIDIEGEEWLTLRAKIEYYVNDRGRQYLNDHLMSMRTEVGEIPDNIDLDNMFNLWISLMMQQDLDRDTLNKIIDFSKHTHTMYSLFIPKMEAMFPESEFPGGEQKKAIEQFRKNLERIKKELFIDIPQQPKVYLLKLKSKNIFNETKFKYKILIKYPDFIQSGKISRIVDIDDPNNWGEEADWIEPEDRQGAEKDYRETAEWLTKGIWEADITDMRQLDQKAMRAFFEPNKIMGTNPNALAPKGRIVYGMYQRSQEKDYSSICDRDILTFGSSVDEFFIKKRDQVQMDVFTKFSTNHWLTDVTEKINQAVQKGVTQLDRLGLMTPAEWLYNQLMRGTLDSNGEILRSVDPMSPMLASTLATDAIDLAQNKEKTASKFKDSTILEVLEPIAVKKITLTGNSVPYLALMLATMKIDGPILPNKAELPVIENLTDTNGETVQLVPGDTILVPTIAFLGDGYYLIISRKDLPSGWDQVKGEVWCIPVEEALTGTIAFDPDNHPVQAFELIVKVISMISVAKILIANPAGSGKVVTEFLKLFNSKETSQLPYMMWKFFNKQGKNMRKYLSGVKEILKP